MTKAEGAENPPSPEEFEVTLIGPGYGESLVLHIGDGSWVIVDSCIDDEGNPHALKYLESIGVNPAQVVDLVVATHWHDDHIRGMAKMVEVCSNAKFCCASTLLKGEFLAAVGALEGHHRSVEGSGVREIHSVFTLLESKASQPTFALGNQLIHVQGKCEIRSLSPSSADFQDFLKSVGNLFPREGQTKTRIPTLSPNRVAVVLWIAFEEGAVLLGSDLEKRGWIEILQKQAQSSGQASVFKVPHHGSANAHEPGVWQRMLTLDPFAVLAPWQKCGRSLPTRNDTQRILACTSNAYITARIGPSRSTRSDKGMVHRTIRESGINLRSVSMAFSAIRLRRPLGSQGQWNIKTFGSACGLGDFVE